MPISPIGFTITNTFMNVKRIIPIAEVLLVSRGPYISLRGYLGQNSILQANICDAKPGHPKRWTRDRNRSMQVTSAELARCLRADVCATLGIGRVPYSAPRQDFVGFRKVSIH